MGAFQDGTGDWTQYRRLTPNKEIDFHVDPRDREPNCHYGSYDDKMDEVWVRTEQAVKEAYEEGIPWVILIHGRSSSRPGKTTSRSVVRSYMRSSESTPYIVKSRSIQHETVFVAAIRPKPKKESP